MNENNEEIETLSEILIKTLFDALHVLIHLIKRVGTHLIMSGLMILIMSTLTENRVYLGAFVGFGDTDQNSNQIINPPVSQSNIPNSGNIIENMYGHKIAPLNSIHYIAGSQTKGSGTGLIREGQMFDFYYYGRDYVNVCGADVYAPFDAVLSYQSNIGGGTPQLTFTSMDGSIKVHSMHLNAIQTSGYVSQGELVGYVDKLGAYSGGVCHGHDSLYVNGKLQDIETYQLEMSESVPETTMSNQPPYQMPYKDWYGIGDAELHGRDNLKGIDVSGGCDTPLYAILSGVVTEVGMETVLSNGKRNSILTITGDDGIHTATILHGNYTPTLNQHLNIGDPVGTEGTIGNSTACHSHIILKENGVEINILP